MPVRKFYSLLLSGGFYGFVYEYKYCGNGNGCTEA